MGSRKLSFLVAGLLGLLLTVASACGGDEPEQVVVTREVQVPVESVVTREVQVPVESVVTREVERVVTVVAPAPTATAVPAGQLDTDGPTYRWTIIGASNPRMGQWTEVDVPYFGDGGIAEQRSNGRIDFTLIGGSESGINQFDRADALKLGVVDFANLGTGSLGSQLPLAYVDDLSGAYSSVSEARAGTKALRDRLSKFTEQVYGTKLLAAYSFSGDTVFCREPLNQLSDLKGRTVRSYGASLTTLLSALGANNRTINFSEVYGALQTGVVDCAITDKASALSQNWNESARYVYDLPVAMGIGYIGVNIDVWKDLPAEVQDFLITLFDEVEDQYWQLAQDNSAGATACLTGDAANCPESIGLADPLVTVIQPVETDLAFLESIFKQSVIPEWLDQCEEKLVTREECRVIFNTTVGAATGTTLE